MDEMKVASRKPLVVIGEMAKGPKTKRESDWLTSILGIRLMVSETLNDRFTPNSKKSAHSDAVIA